MSYLTLFSRVIIILLHSIKLGFHVLEMFSHAILRGSNAICIYGVYTL